MSVLPASVKELSYSQRIPKMSTDGSITSPGQVGVLHSAQVAGGCNML